MSQGLDHDWHSVFATPKPKIGDRAKTNLLIILCFLWVFAGIIGHEPWKPDELQSISIIKSILDGGSWVLPSMAGQPWLDAPPLYYLTAAACAQLLSPILDMHDAARLASALWMSLTLLFVGMTGRELWGVGSGRQTTLIFISSIGLVFTAHQISPEVTGLTAYSLAFYALALAPRRPLRAGLFLGSAIGIGFLSKGILNLEIIITTTLLLPVLFTHWRRLSYLKVLVVASIFALPWIAPWLLALQKLNPGMYEFWLADSQLVTRSSGYFAKNLLWYAWPALPLAGWSLWRLRPNNPSVQLPVLFLIVLFGMLSISLGQRLLYLMPLLLPLTLLATPAIEMLNRSLASLLDWFGVMLFGAIGFLIWLGWIAMITGHPVKLAERMHKLSLAYVPQFVWWLFLPALLLTVIWFFVVFKNKRTNRAVVTDWAVGMALAWGVLMTLWLPWLDAAKSYKETFISMQKALPSRFACITSHYMGDAQRAAVDYYLNIHVFPFEITQNLGCDLYLLQDERDRANVDPGQDWKLIWQGKRPSDRRESFRLFQRTD
jgi:4-amino-4-deoxy-L-arabinose transferase-like glycosyltransferase